MFKVDKSLIAAGLAVCSAFVTAPAGASYLQTLAFFNDNDCSGAFGQGFDNCNVTLGDTEYSAVIAKFNSDGTVNDLNGTVYPSVDGSEFSFELSADGQSLLWEYSPDEGDPAIHFWVAKAAKNFTLYWMTPDEIYSELADSLEAALSVTNGSVSFSQLSHITFYNGEPYNPPDEIPLPGAVWLFGSALLGFVTWSRRRAV